MGPRAIATNAGQQLREGLKGHHVAIPANRWYKGPQIGGDAAAWFHRRIRLKHTWCGFHVTDRHAERRMIEGVPARNGPGRRSALS